MTYEDNLQLCRQKGRADALDLRSRSPQLTGTELIAEEGKIPPFDPGRDYSSWSAGNPVTDEDQVWTLLIPHNAAAFTGRPAALRSLWGLAHTTDPAKAKPWVAPYGTSGLYKEGECCTWEGRTYRNLYPDNAFAPLTQGAQDRWEEVAL